MNITFPCEEGNHIACKGASGWCQCYCHKPLRTIRDVPAGPGWEVAERQEPRNEERGWW